jgi:ribA/ribD-fused uncharacterized protein
MITQFIDEYRWLSNFQSVQIKYDGRTYPSVEHAYVSAKSNDDGWKQLCTSSKYRAGDLKKVSKDIELREDWEDVKVFIMYDLLKLKFVQEPFKTKLLNTGDMELIEGNYWGDTFYGVDMNKDEGQNILGRLIMKIRKEIRDGNY